MRLDEIPKMQPLEKLPLDEMEARDPGTFELVYETLHWWPSTVAMATAHDRGDCILELLDANCRPLGLTAEPLLHLGPDRKFRIEQSGTPPVFARFRHRDGTNSCTGVIARVQDLQTQTRDPLTASTERAIRELEMDDDEGLWLLDVIQTLSAPSGERSATAHARLGKTKKADGAKPLGQLDYEAFMRGRRREIKSSEAERSALSGSHASFVRAALNRLD